MAAYVKFEAFIQHLVNKEHDLFGTTDTLKVYLSNTAPNVATHAVKVDPAEISAGNGYTSGGHDTQNDSTRTGGTVTMTGVSLTITASGGTIGPFRYVVLYNDTPTTPNADPLIAYWDYGSSITLLDGESFSIKFNNAAVSAAGTIATFA